MKNTMEYKGYLGSVEFDEEEGLLFGRVMGIRSLISYEGESAKELLQKQALFSIALVLFLFIMLINAALNFFLKGDKAK